LNFLSHYYLHRNENIFFTVGLTLPDLLSFHSRKVRVSKNYLIEKKEILTEIHLLSCIDGMNHHIEVDRWFHNSLFFKNGCVLLRDNYIKVFNRDDIHHMTCHILLEILIDRYLLIIESDLADKFYSSYNLFNFNDVTRIFLDLKNFETDKFIDLTDNIKKSSFLKEYKDNDLVLAIMGRITDKVGIRFIDKSENKSFSDFLNLSYQMLEKEIFVLFEEIKRINFSQSI